MTRALDHAVAAARRRLGPEAQSDLAETIERFVASRADDPHAAMYAAQQRELHRRMTAPFVEADAADVDALFRKYG